jgi:hypothetical protein
VCRDTAGLLRVYFSREKRPYTVKACDNRYAICTKPFNPLKTVLYTIIDAEQGVRGTNNLVFNIYDYKKQEDIEECLKDLSGGEVEVSHRNRVALDIVKVVTDKQAV